MSSIPDIPDGDKRLLYSLISELSTCIPKPEPHEVYNRCSLFDDLGYDSLRFIELIVRIEAVFSIEVKSTAMNLSNFETPIQIMRFISEARSLMNVAETE